MAKSELGFGIRAGAAKSDIRTTDALKRALREAKSITFPQDGASRGISRRCSNALEIGAEVKPKNHPGPWLGSGYGKHGGRKGFDGDTLFSEIVPIPGVEILGPLPGEFHSEIRFSAGLSRTSQSQESAKAPIAFLAGPKVASAFKAKAARTT